MGGDDLEPGDSSVSGYYADAEATCSDQWKIKVYGKKVTLNLNGKTLTGKGNVSGYYRIEVVSGGNLTIEGGGTLTGFGNSESAGIYIAQNASYSASPANSKVVLKDNCKVTSGGRVFVDTGCEFEMQSGEISESHTSYSGGAVWVNGGTFTMSGGTIKDCSSDENGGAVYVVKYSSYKGEFIMNGGTIENCTAQTGGAVYLEGGAALGDCTFTMDGAEAKITNCNSNDSGAGGVYSYKSVVNIKQGTISECTANSLGAGIVNVGGALNIGGGKVIINGNTVNGSPVNVYELDASDSNATIKVIGNLNDGSRVGVTFADSNATNLTLGEGPFTGLGNIYCENNGIDKIVTADGSWVTAKAKIGNVKYASVAAALTDANAALVDTTITMCADSTESATLNITNLAYEITLDLAGHTLTGPGGANCVIIIGDKCAFVLKDTVGDGKVVQPTGATEDAIYINDDVFNTVPEDITTFKMLSGKIECGATGYSNAAVKVSGNGSFELVDGTIHSSGCKGVYVAVSNFTMTGGTITSDTSCGVFMVDGVFKFNGGEIKDCTSNDVYGAGIHAESSATIVMNDGSIINCKTTEALAKGGGVYIWSDSSTPSQFTMNGGTITNCKTTGGSADGGGVCIEKNTQFIMNGGSITDCQTTVDGAHGGGVAISESAQFTMNAGTISGCSTPDHGKGGGVYAKLTGSSYYAFIMSGGSISDCTAGYSGGGVCLDIGSAQITGGTITNCSAGYSGGGVHIDLGNTLEMEGGSITECSASYTGGGVYVHPDAFFTVKGNTVINDNKVGSNLNNVFLDSAGSSEAIIKLTGNLGSTASIGVSQEGVTSVTSDRNPYNEFGQDATASYTGADKFFFDRDPEIVGYTYPDDGTYFKGFLVWEFPRVAENYDGSEKYLTVKAALGSSSSATYVRMIRDSQESDITLSRGSEEAPIVLDLNGHTLTGTGSSSVIRVNSGHLKLKDSSASAGSEGTGKITMAQGSTYGGKGGGVKVASDSSFTMESGTITGCSAENGAGVYLDGGKLKMTGGKIIGNLSSSEGGGIYMYGYSSAYFSGSATVIGNRHGSVVNNLFVNMGSVFQDGDLTGSIGVSDVPVYNQNSGNILGKITPPTAQYVGTDCFFMDGNSSCKGRLRTDNPAHADEIIFVKTAKKPSSGSNSGGGSGTGTAPQSIVEAINNAAQTTGVAEVYGVDSLTYEEMSYLQGFPNVTLILNYEYGGTSYRVAINGLYAYADKSIPCYGPLYLAGMYGNTTYNANVYTVPTGKVVYVVKRGDTLSKIAKRYNTTVTRILALNPSIKNRNRINVGKMLIIDANR